MSDNYKHRSPGGYGQFLVQPLGYSIENRPQLNFDGYQGQSHGFVQGNFLNYTQNPNPLPNNTRRADYPSWNTHVDSQPSVQTRPLYQQSPPQIELPHRGRSCTLPGSKNTQPTVFEGYCKASWNRRQMYDSGGVGIPSSQNDPYAGVRKWNELNSQQFFFYKNSSNPPLSRIPSTGTKPMPLGPRYARARRKPEVHQRTPPPNSQHPPNPGNLLSSSHNHTQPCLEGEGKAEHRLRGQGDSVPMMGGLAASESAPIRILDPTVANSTPSGPRSPVFAESPISGDGSGGSGTSDEYMGFIIPSDPYTFHSVQKSSRRVQSSGADHTKAEATENSGMAVKDQVTELTRQQLAPKIKSSSSKTGSLLGPAENPMGRDDGGNSGAEDEYMGFIIPSDPYTFHPVQESSKRFQNPGADYMKTEATKHNGMTLKDQVIALICQQPAPKVNSSGSGDRSLLGPAEKPMSKDGGGNSGANDEYMGFIIPSDPYTFHPVQKSSKRVENSGADYTKAETTKHNGMSVKDQVIALICQQPAPKVNSSNSKTGSMLGPAQNPMSKDGGGNSGANDEYIGFIIPSDPYTLHVVQNGNTMSRNFGTDHEKVQITEVGGKAPQDQITALVVQQPALKVNSSSLKTATQQADARENQAHSLQSREIVLKE
ncbi:hypothetical protein HOY80DRAFT_1138756 [Tuber brumale]|nr:hypothetical protein HOY80DRAFT_1138756 [Tuber brumale]